MKDRPIMGNGPTYEKMLAIRIQEITDSVVDLEKSLRCCGNCLNMTNEPRCKLGRHDDQRITCPFRVCDDWAFDGLTHEERMIR